jgi:hypothetical protein
LNVLSRALAQIAQTLRLEQQLPWLRCPSNQITGAPPTPRLSFFHAALLVFASVALQAVVMLGAQLNAPQVVADSVRCPHKLVAFKVTWAQCAMCAIQTFTAHLVVNVSNAPVGTPQSVSHYQSLSWSFSSSLFAFTSALVQ